VVIAKSKHFLYNCDHETLPASANLHMPFAFHLLP
jgi:hypothetical protein